MGVVYVQNNSPWEAVGGLLGQYLGKRYQDVQKTNEAKAYAKSMYGYDPEQQSQPATQGLLSGLGQHPLSGQTVPATYEQAAQTLSANNNQLAPTPVDDPYAIPDRTKIAAKTRTDMGRNYLALVKGGMSNEEARQAVLQKQQQNENTQFAAAVDSYRTNTLDPARAQIIQAISQAGYSPERMKQVYPAIAQYNQLASRVGEPTLDINTLNNVNGLDKPNMKYMNMPNGELVGINADTGKIQNEGNYGKKNMQFAGNGQGFIVGQDGSYTPIGNFSNRQLKQFADGTVASFNPGTGQYEVLGKYAATTSGPGTSGLQAKQLAVLSAQHANWVKLHPADDETESPYYTQLQSALNGNAPSNTGASNPVAQRIDELRAAGWTPEQIRSGLEANGLGDYKSWVW